MANLEFLLQKKGDRQWGTAHKPAIKLKTGSYRIAAQGKPRTDVHVEIIFETQDAEGNLVRRSQNRMKSTNERGLMAIMPFTQFKPGDWEIICRSLDLSNEPWEQTIRLRILPVAVPKPKIFKPLPLPPNPNLFSFEASLSLPEQEQIEPVETEETVLDRSLAKLMAARTDSETGEFLREMVESTLRDLDQPSEEVEDELDDWTVVDETASGLLQGSLLELEELLKEDLEPIWQEMEQSAQQQTTPPSNEPIAITPPFIGIALSQPVYIWQNNAPIEIQGSLTAIAAIPSEYQGSLANIRLCFTLRNPQTSEKLVFVGQDITQLICPHSFRQAFSIDPQWRTLAIVGEISLEAAGQPLKILATQSFNLIADYQAIAAHIKLPEVPPEEQAAPERSSNKLDLDLPSPTAAESWTTEPRPASILPPKLGAQPKSYQAPTLPNFMQPTAPEETKPAIADANLEDLTMPALPGGDAPILMTEHTATVKTGAANSTDNIPYPFVLEPEVDAATNADNIPYPFVLEPEVTEPESAPQTDLDNLAIATAATDANDLEAEADATEPEAPQADLDWNSRFFTRLNALAADSDNSAWLQEPVPEEQIEPEPVTNEISTDQSVVILHRNVEVLQPLDANLFPLENQADPSLTSFSAEIVPRPFTMEIVVDDDVCDEKEQADKPEPIQPIYDASGLPYPQEVLSSEEQDGASLEIMGATIPEPVLNVSKPEYQAEDIAVVRVILPPYADRLYVKLWMQDRQSRTILVGPYQLTDFTTDRDGNSETLMQMQIPSGTTEVRFEAIAINPRLQQESRKVGIDRRVVSKEFSDINWDDLGI